jgi:anaerobic selenocysteine-containing dehydrogenase
VELLDERTIGRVHGSADNDYTVGVVCAKVARYAEREHHPQRVLHPLRRRDAKGSGEFERISWDAALDLVAENFIRVEQRHGAESVWPYYYAGTMGLVMRDGINRLRHVKKYSGFHSTIGDHLGHECGQYTGQRDDPRRARPQRARREDRGG